jgi:DtxR family Mn-dependent transcriptional regulator
MGVAMSSVNGALKRLIDKGLVHHERYEFVDLTHKGEQLAKKILDRHNLLTHLLHDMLRVDPETADKDACAIEHHLSQETIDRILDFFFFIEVCPKGTKTWKKYYDKCLNGSCNEEQCSLRMLRPEGRHVKVTGDESLTLKHIRPGFTVQVKKILATGSLRKRLMDMGFSQGVNVEVLRVAPLGDPVEVKVRGYNLSLRKDEADSIVVQLMEKD